MLAKHFGLNRASRWMLMGCLSVGCLGCSICPSPYDDDYGTYGTKTPRTDMRHGRVGSVFSDPVYTGLGSTDREVHQEVYQDGYGHGTIVEQEIITEGIITEGQLLGPSASEFGPGVIIIE
ncbi:MAG: hypothetical protein NTV29_16625 [Planctomycetota bacterium]|nr:hypothetical protein [Planctomycetota bacterium]